MNSYMSFVAGCRVQSRAAGGDMPSLVSTRRVCTSENIQRKQVNKKMLESHSEQFLLINDCFEHTCSWFIMLSVGL